MIRSTFIPKQDKPGCSAVSTVDEWFKTQALRIPDAKAVVLGKEFLTYRELDRMSDQFAAILCSRGVEPDMPVGILMTKSLEMIIAILAVLKAGGAYVPLDPDYPQERLQFMVEDAGIRVLLCTQKLRSRWKPAGNVEILHVRTSLVEAEGEALKQRIPRGPGNLAYVIYTSGSTGKPKGVMIEHRSLIHYVRASQEHYQINERDRVLQFSSISFDASVEEIFCTLCQGATLVLRTDEMLGSIQYFVEAITSMNISVLSLPTSFWHQFASTVSHHRLRLPSSLRLVAIGGEKVLAERVIQWQQSGNAHVRLLNTYGPTETTVVATVFDISRWKSKHEEPFEVPIGTPISGYDLYVVDSSRNLLPPGGVGELLIGGPCVARGYLNRQSLTDEKFIHLKLPSGEQRRVYCTGDLVRQKEQNVLEFCGRVDHQVKLRGFRIEPAEIERSLRSMEGVEDAIVMVREVPSGQQHLVAYILGTGAQPVDPASIKARLSQNFPEWMVPSFYMILDMWPLSPNGKVDRLALPLPPVEQCEEVKTIEREATKAEYEIRKIWKRILHRDAGLQDDFFAIGGNSLAAVEFLTEVQTVFKRRIELSCFLEQPTIEALAREVENPVAPNATSKIVVPLQQGTGNSSFFCIPGIGGHVITFAPLAGMMGSDHSFYGLQPPGFDGREETSLRTVEQMAAFLIERMRQIQPEGPYLLGGHCFGSIIAFEMARQLNESGQQVGALILIDPWVELFPQKQISLSFNRIRFHLLKLKHLDWRSRRKYLRQKAVDFLSRIQVFLQHAARSPVKRADQLGEEMLAAYRPKPLEVKVTVFLAKDIYLSLDSAQDPRRHWERLVPQGIETIELPGDHMSIFQKPHASLFAQKLRAILTRVVTTVQAVTLKTLWYFQQMMEAVEPMAAFV